MLCNLLSFPSFLSKAFNICWDYCVKNPALAIIAAVLCVAIIALAIAIPCVAASRKKKRLAREAAENKSEQPATTEQPAAESQSPVAAEPAEIPQVAEETPTAEQPAPATEPAEIPQVAEETQPAPAAEQPAPATEPAEIPQAAEETQPAPTAEKEPKTEQSVEENSVQPVPAPVEEENTPVQATPAPEENSVAAEVETGAGKQKKYTGKWVVFHMATSDESSANKDEDLFFFELHASNGEKLLSSEEYTSYSGALRGIDTHKKNILAGNFRITLSKKGDYIFKLLNGKNTLLCTGANYPSKARCEKAIESAKRFAETAVLDENTREVVLKLPPEEDAPIAALPEGCVGKWIISANTSAEGETVYFFDLFANNGEKLLSSEEYSSYIGAVNGIETHKKNIVAGNFRIVLTKRGDYIYKLLNGNGQLLCLGEHYKTRKRCQNAVESVKRFAASSPVLTSEKIKKN